MNMFAMEVFAEQLRSDRMREAEHERLVRELRAGSPRPPRARAWSIVVLRRLAGSVRSALFAGASLARPSATLPPSRD